MDELLPKSAGESIRSYRGFGKGDPMVESFYDAPTQP